MASRASRIMQRIQRGESPYGGGNFQQWYSSVDPGSVDSEVSGIIQGFGYGWPPPRATAAPGPASIPDISPALAERLKTIEGTISSLQPQVQKLLEPVKIEPAVKAKLFENVKEALEPRYKELETRLDEFYSRVGQFGTDFHKQEKRKLKEKFEEEMRRSKSEIEIEAAMQDIASDLKNREILLQLYNNSVSEMLAFLEQVRAERAFTESTRRYESERQEREEERRITRELAGQVRREKKASTLGRLLGMGGKVAGAILGGR